MENPILPCFSTFYIAEIFMPKNAYCCELSIRLATETRFSSEPTSQVACLYHYLDSEHVQMYNLGRLEQLYSLNPQSAFYHVGPEDGVRRSDIMRADQAWEVYTFADLQIPHEQLANMDVRRVHTVDDLHANIFYLSISPKLKMSANQVLSMRGDRFDSVMMLTYVTMLDHTIVFSSADPKDYDFSQASEVTRYCLEHPISDIYLLTDHEHNLAYQQALDTASCFCFYRNFGNCNSDPSALIDIDHAYFDIISFDKQDECQHQTIVDVMINLLKSNQALAKKYLTDFSYLTHHVNSRMTLGHKLESLFDRLLADQPAKRGHLYLSREEQINALLKMSKNSIGKSEIVSDEILQTLRDNPLYHEVLEQLKAKQFGISTTQQENVLETVAYFNCTANNVKTYSSAAQADNVNFFYNLADMGAGKTLMTVEAVYLADLLYVQKHEDCIRKDTGLEPCPVPDKYLIAPDLAIKSSWLETFALFYDLTKVNDYHYRLTAKGNQGEYTMQSDLYFSPFKVRNDQLHVPHQMQAPRFHNYYLQHIVNQSRSLVPDSANGDYVIIDEVHQLANRPVSLARFFQHYPLERVSLDSCHVFVLSGTLSNLTTDQWRNLIKMFGLSIKFDSLGYDYHTRSNSNGRRVRDFVELAQHRLVDYVEQAVKSAVKQDYGLAIADNCFMSDELKSGANKKQTNIASAFDLSYAPHLILPHHSHINNINRRETVQNGLVAGDAELVHDPDILAMPNFILFYRLVGHQAITASSSQIARELYPDHDRKHQAQIIKVPSNFAASDLQLLKDLHILAKGAKQHHARRLGTKIDQAMLNLNDGLSRETLYSIINQGANDNLNFLKYLKSLKLDCLQKLAQSKLIKEVKLEDTEKFQIVQKLLADEPDEKFIIVANDFDASSRLAKALGFKALSHREYQEPANYQEVIDKTLDHQQAIVVPQEMIKSSLNLIKASRLIQYQLNDAVSDIIQTQNRIDRVGQKADTKAYYLACDCLQEQMIELFLRTYRNIKVAHKGISELFVDPASQIDIVDDYLDESFRWLQEKQEQEKQEKEQEKQEKQEKQEQEKQEKEQEPAEEKQEKQVDGLSAQAFADAQQTLASCLQLDLILE